MIEVILKNTDSDKTWDSKVFESFNPNKTLKS